MIVTPLNDYLLVEPIQTESETPGGIIISENAKEKPIEGKVISLSATAKDNVKVGDTVMYKKWGGIEVKVDDKDMLLISELDLLAIISR